jgi:hypothetical protein
MTRSRKRKPSRASFNPLDSKIQIDRLAFSARLAIQIVGGGLALIFTWLQVKDFPIKPFVENIEPQVFLKLILAFYYSCWVFGLSFDVTTQQAVYVKDPSRGRFSWDAISAVVALAIVAAVLCGLVMTRENSPLCSAHLWSLTLLSGGMCYSA